jgi:hypothetical protein
LTAIVQVACAAASVPPASAIDPEPAAAVTAPPQVFAVPGGVATTRLVGSVSVNARPDCAGLPVPLVIVKVSVDTVFGPTTSGLNCLASELPTTASEAFTPAAVRPPARAPRFELLFT